MSTIDITVHFDLKKRLQKALKTIPDHPLSATDKIWFQHANLVHEADFLQFLREALPYNPWGEPMKTNGYYYNTVLCMSSVFAGNFEKNLNENSWKVRLSFEFDSPDLYTHHVLYSNSFVINGTPKGIEALQELCKIWPGAKDWYLSMVKDLYNDVKTGYPMWYQAQIVPHSEAQLRELERIFA